MSRVIDVYEQQRSRLLERLEQARRDEPGTVAFYKVMMMVIDNWPSGMCERALTIENEFAAYVDSEMASRVEPADAALAARLLEQPRLRQFLSMNPEKAYEAERAPIDQRVLAFWNSTDRSPFLDPRCEGWYEELMAEFLFKNVSEMYMFFRLGAATTSVNFNVSLINYVCFFYKSLHPRQVAGAPPARLGRSDQERADGLTRALLYGLFSIIRRPVEDLRESLIRYRQVYTFVFDTAEYSPKVDRTLYLALLYPFESDQTKQYFRALWSRMSESQREDYLDSLLDILYYEADPGDLRLVVQEAARVMTENPGPSLTDRQLEQIFRRPYEIEEEQEPIVADLQQVFATRTMRELFQRYPDGTVLFGIPRCDFSVQGLCEDYILSNELIVLYDGTLSCTRCAAYVGRDEPEIADMIVPIRTVNYLKDDYAREMGVRVTDFVSAPSFSPARYFALPSVSELFSQLVDTDPFESLALPARSDSYALPARLDAGSSVILRPVAIKSPAIVLNASSKPVFSKPSLRAQYEFTEPECPLCSKTITMDEAMCALECGHILCQECFQGLLRSQNKRCPMCRAQPLVKQPLGTPRALLNAFLDWQLTLQRRQDEARQPLPSSKRSRPGE